MRLRASAFAVATVAVLSGGSLVECGSAAWAKPAPPPADHITFTSPGSAKFNAVKRGRLQSAPSGSNLLPPKVNPTAILPRFAVIGQMNVNQRNIRFFRFDIRNLNVRNASFPRTFSTADGDLDVRYATGSFSGSTYVPSGEWIENPAETFIVTLTSFRQGRLRGRFSGILVDNPDYAPTNPSYTMNSGDFRVKVKFTRL